MGCSGMSKTLSEDQLFINITTQRDRPTLQQVVELARAYGIKNVSALWVLHNDVMSAWADNKDYTNTIND